MRCEPGNRKSSFADQSAGLAFCQRAVDVIFCDDTVWATFAVLDVLMATLAATFTTSMRVATAGISIEMSFDSSLFWSLSSTRAIMGVTCGELAIQDIRKDIIGDKSHHPGFGPWGLGSPAPGPTWSVLRPSARCCSVWSVPRLAHVRCPACSSFVETACRDEPAGRAAGHCCRTAIADSCRCHV